MHKSLFLKINLEILLKIFVFLASAGALSGSPALAGAPLIMQQAAQPRNALSAANNNILAMQMHALNSQALLQQQAAPAQDYQQLLLR